MSRSGYSDDWYEDNRAGLYRGAVERAMTGKRGQAALHELLAALDAMPDRALAAESLVTADGKFCTLGVLGHARGLDMRLLDPVDFDAVAKAFGLATSMVREIAFENDDDFAYTFDETQENRWRRMRAFVAAQIKTPNVALTGRPR